MSAFVSHTSQDDQDDEMQIFVKVAKTVGLKVKKSGTIGDIKSKFRDEEGVPENLQEIFYSGNHLDNNQKLADCEIKKHSTLYMVVHSKVGMQIFVKIPSAKKIITLDVKPWDTIQNIKAIIYDKEKYPAEQQRLVYTGRTLNDDQTLAICNIRSNSTLHLIVHCPDNFQIFVNTQDGKNISLDVKSRDTVEDIKVMIESILGVPFDKQQLLYDEEELTDRLCLNDYEISQGAFLHMNSLLMQIFVMTYEGKTITLEVGSSDTISHLRTKIEEKLGASIAHYNLDFSRRLLKDDKTLADYNVQKNSTIRFVMSVGKLGRYINVATPENGVITLDVNPSCTINRVKTMIFERTGIVCSEQTLLYSGEKLCSKHTLEENSVPLGSTLHLTVNDE